MDWFAFLIVSLATFRITHLFVYDKIMEWFRTPFFDEIKIIEGHGEEEVYVVPKKGGIKGFIGELLNCYWCTGVWIAGISVLAWYLVPAVATPILIIFAVAGVASFMETVVQKLTD